MKKFEDNAPDRSKIKYASPKPQKFEAPQKKILAPQKNVDKADKKSPKMSRNFLYSIALHLSLIIFIFFSFSLHHKNEVDKKEKIVINFVINNKTPEITKAPKPAQAIPPKNIEPEPKKEPEKVPEKPKTPEKPAKEEKRPEPKKEDKKQKTKPDKKEKKPAPKPKKPEPKKPEPKKPEPKKEEPKKEEPKPKKEEPKEEPKKEEEKPKEEPKEVVEEPSFTENTIDKLNLLVREKFNIQNQIVGCYKRALDQYGGKSTETISAHIELDRDGSIDVDHAIFKDYARYKNPGEIEYRKGVDIVKQTLIFCSPLRNLPEDKYDVWKEIDFQFDAGK